MYIMLEHRYILMFFICARPGPAFGRPGLEGIVRTCTFWDGNTPDASLRACGAQLGREGSLLFGAMGWPQPFPPFPTFSRFWRFLLSNYAGPWQFYRWVLTVYCQITPGPDNFYCQITPGPTLHKCNVSRGGPNWPGPKTLPVWRRVPTDLLDV